MVMQTGCLMSIDSIKTTTKTEEREKKNDIKTRREYTSNKGKDNEDPKKEK